LTDKRLHWGEKLFWVIALSLSICACSYLIHDSYRKWKAAPVIVSFSERFINIWEIPFAAVTICPIGGIDPLNRNFSASNSSDDETPLKNFTRLVDIDYRITGVKWRDLRQNSSSQLFTQIVTEEGFCYTFNSMNFNDLFEKGV
jgi:acid-sensing ion channel, other